MTWWGMVRRVVIFLLGVAVILDALIGEDQASAGNLAVGLIMVGVLPLDDLISWAVRPRRPEDQPARPPDGR